MTTFYSEQNKSDEENAQEAIKVFPFLNDTSAMNLISWLNDRPSMSGIIDSYELQSLEGVVWS